MNYKKLLIILASIFLLQSCGLKFWYNRLDWVVTWQVDDYVELTDQQEEKLEALVREKLQWHRTTQLPRYIALISELEQDLGTEAINQKYEYYQDQFIDFYRTAADEVTSELVEQVADLDDSQVAELSRNLNNEASKRKKKFDESDPDERLEDVEDNIADGFKDWAGKLTKSQKSIIKQWVKEMQPTAELRFEYTNKWRVAMDYALAARNTEQGKANILELILNPRSLQSEELQSRYKSNQTLEKRYILELHSTMTKKQKKRFLRKLKSYREDFQDLMDD